MSVDDPTPHERYRKIHEDSQMEVLQTLLTELRIWPDSEGNLRMSRSGTFLQFDAYTPGQPDGDGWKLYTHIWHRTEEET